MFPTATSLRFALLPAFALGAAGQDVTFTNPVAGTGGFGTDAIIVGDVNGGGLRDVVVANAATTELRLMLSEAPAAPGTVVAAGIGTQLASLGNLSGGPGDEFVSVATGFGVFWQDVAGTYTGLFSFGVPSASVGAVVAVSDLTGDGQPEIAIGDPVLNAIHVCDAANGVFLYTITDPRVGSLGTSLAAGPLGELAAGAPTWSSTVPPTVTRGYVNIYILRQTAATMTRTIINPPAVAAQGFGQGVAQVGDVTGDLVTDYAVLSPSGAVGTEFLCLVSSASPAIVAAIGYGIATPPGVGRIATTGDIDGDNLADVMMVAGTSLQVFTTTGGALVALTGQVGTFDGALTSGADVFNTGFNSVLVAQNTTTAAATVQVSPLAAWRNLPNPPGCAILPPPPTQRSILGALWPLTVTTTSTNSILALLVIDFAPAANLPFGNGTAYINVGAGTAQVLGSGGVVAGGPITFTGSVMPVSPVFLNFGLVYQATTIDALGAFQVSNGILVRIGAF